MRELGKASRSAGGLPGSVPPGLRLWDPAHTASAASLKSVPPDWSHSHLPSLPFQPRKWGPPLSPHQYSPLLAPSWRDVLSPAKAHFPVFANLDGNLGKRKCARGNMIVAFIWQLTGHLSKRG